MRKKHINDENNSITMEIARDVRAIKNNSYSEDGRGETYDQSDVSPVIQVINAEDETGNNDIPPLQAKKKSRKHPSSCTPTKEQSTLQGALKTPIDIITYFVRCREGELQQIIRLLKH